MTTIVELTSRLTAIKKARDTGALMVRHGDTSTEFRSLEEMERIIALLEGEIATLSGTPRSRVHYVRQVTKGL